jgi:hypothetical protein
MDHFESTNFVEEPIVGQKRKLMLKTERCNPDIVTEASTFFERLRHGPNSGRSFRTRM